ncbi:MAG: hypothetical protein Q7R83_04120 [bacterium]|nr:hypothetical protein [bacterium]
MKNAGDIQMAMKAIALLAQDPRMTPRLLKAIYDGGVDRAVGAMHREFFVMASSPTEPECGIVEIPDMPPVQLSRIVREELGITESNHLIDEERYYREYFPCERADSRGRKFLVKVWQPDEAIERNYTVKRHFWDCGEFYGNTHAFLQWLRVCNLTRTGLRYLSLTGKPGNRGACIGFIDYTASRDARLMEDMTHGIRRRTWDGTLCKPSLPSEEHHRALECDTYPEGLPEKITFVGFKEISG